MFVKRFADAKRKTDAVHGMYGADGAAQDAASHRIVLFQIRYLEQRARLGHVGPAISAARQHAARWLAPQLSSGGYSSQSDVVRDALRLLHREKAVEHEKQEILRDLRNYKAADSAMPVRVSGPDANQGPRPSESLPPGGPARLTR